MALFTVLLHFSSICPEAIAFDLCELMEMTKREEKHLCEEKELNFCYEMHPKYFIIKKIILQNSLFSAALPLHYVD